MDPVRVLLVEDEEVAALILQSRLEEMGYCVVGVASSGKSAIKKAGETPLNLVLMDIVLTGDMDGVEAAEEITSRFNIPVVYVTSCIDDTVLQRVKISGPGGYILKPFRKHELHAAIQIALYRHEVEKQLKRVRDDLEIKVAERTSELALANKLLQIEANELKRANEAIGRLTHRSELILNSVDEGILGLDPRGNFTFVNAAAAEMLGFDAEELIGQTIHKVCHHFEEDGSSYSEEECPIHNPCSSITSCPSTGNTFRRNDGSLFPVRYSRAPVVENAKVVGAVVTFRDMTEHRLAEEEKARLESHLQRASKLEAIGTLAGGIAHDFNNILAVIVGYSEMAMDSVPESNRAHSNLREILTAANRAKELVRQILAFSRMKPDERPVPVRMSFIVKEVLRFLRASLPKTIEISQRIDGVSGSLLADPTQIHQVLLNLCTNAAHAMRDKGGTLEISLDEIKADSKTLLLFPELEPGPFLRLTVTDTGHGMDEITMARIFDPYFTTKGVGEGSGLGLAVVHGIVRSLDGAITVHSEPGKGTRFEVYLPRVESISREESSPSIPISRGNERILFVDDEDTLVHVGRVLLQRLGYRVTEERSSTKALDIFRSRPDQFDLVITDYTMPQLTGADIAREILNIRPNIPIILCTGFSEQITEEKVREMGIRKLLMKPIEIRSMAEAIRMVLDAT